MMARLEKRRMKEIETQLSELRFEHRRAIDSWKTFHRLRLDIEALSKILQDEKESIQQGQLIFEVDSPKPSSLRSRYGSRRRTYRLPPSE